MKPHLFALSLLVPMAASAGEAPPPLPPEIKRTVDALAGKWTLNFTMTGPGQAAPTKFVDKFDCKRVSGGRGVLCSDKATVPGMGNLDFTHLIAYDPERKAVHWFAVGSTGEVHDHTCRWKDEKTLDCEPLKATLGGQPLTETVTITFDGDKSTWVGTTKIKDGDTRYEAAGKRGG